MKNKKIIFLGIFLSLLSANILAQNKSLWFFGVEAGINCSNSSEDTAPLKKECPVLPKIGLNVEYNFTNNFYIQSGVTYSMKGLKSKGETEFLKASVSLSQHLIQIPLLVAYKLPLGNERMNVGFGAGIYGACGIGGKTKAVGQLNGQDIDIEVNVFDNLLKRYDFGSIFKLSFQRDHFLANLSYEYGLADVGISNVLGAPLSYENRVFSISIGYIF